MRWKYFYYYVGPCPSCKGNHTGRIIHDLECLNPQKLYNMTRRLKRIGERFLYEQTKWNEDNAFCENCGFRWKAQYHFRFMTREDWEEFSGTTSETMLRFKKYKKQEKRRKKREKRQKKREMRKAARKKAPLF